jgi:hypothetical protein
MIALPDVNVLIALAWKRHEHHTAARRWFGGVKHFATCPITELGFLRVSTLTEHALDLSQARAVLQDILDFKPHTFLPGDVKPLAAPVLAAGPQQLTDAWLAALAMRHKARLATFDREITKLRGLKPEHLETLSA